MEMWGTNVGLVQSLLRVVRKCYFWLGFSNGVFTFAR
jgi:hypothetical protein